MSAISFALFGALLVSPPIYDFNRGYHFGNIAVNIMNQTKASISELTPQINLMMYGSISVFRQPFQCESSCVVWCSCSCRCFFSNRLGNCGTSTACVGKLLEGYEQGALIGDTHYAMICLSIYASTRLWACGESLPTLEKDVERYVRRALQHKNDFVAVCTLADLSLVKQLVGSGEDGYSKYFRRSEDEFLHGKSELAAATHRLLCHKKLFFSLFSRDMEAALHWSRESRLYSRGTNATFAIAIYSEFLHGLVALHFARQPGNHEEDRGAMGEDAINLMRKWAASSDWNFSNKSLLFEAEYYFDKDEAKAQEKYRAAIEAARNHRFVHDEGLANEKAASFHLHHGRKEEALLHFAQAKACYERWGARALVRIIDCEIHRLSCP